MRTVSVRLEHLRAFLLDQGIDPASFTRFVAELDTDLRVGGPTTESIDPTPPPTEAGDAARPAPLGLLHAGPTLVRDAVLGLGGMAEVWRARDVPLDRTLAMKVLREHLKDRTDMQQRMVDEARLTARLAHPSIPAVHAIGADAGLPWFTMTEVKGTTLHDVIVQAHQPTPAPNAWSMGRLLDAYQRVCEATAFAHANGVIHCDLKPSNVMVGAFGEVLVMDWGVARVSSWVNGRRVWKGLGGTSVVSGTAGYMPPEQQLGQADLLSPAADVYALGVLLYVLLTGRRAFTEPRGDAMLRQQQAMAYQPLSPSRNGFRPDDAIRAIVTRALQTRPEDRFPDAGALASEFALWREGAKRRDQATLDVRDAERALPLVNSMQQEARNLREVAASLLGALPPDAPAEAKAPAWAIEDEAASVERAADRKQTEIVNQLRSALARAHDLPEADRLLAAIHREAYEDAERRRDWRAATRHEAVVRAHDDGTLSRWLAAGSQVQLATDPPARAYLTRLVERGRRLVGDSPRDLGTTPVTVNLAVGSYLVEFVAPGRPTVRLPVLAGRFEVLDTGVVTLPAALDPDEVFVPGGPASLGGDPLAPGAVRAHKAHVDPFVIRRVPVTFGELFTFLAEPGSREVRRAFFRSGVSVFREDRPARGVSWHVATAFAAWQAARTGVPWRLPTELEWEKAARGVDGRWFPWGDVFDPAFAHVHAGGAAPNAPRSVRAHALDRSPYGVLGMAGNVREWCSDAWRPDDDAVRVVRGGSWRTAVDAARCAARAGLPAAVGHVDVGLRLVRSLA